MQKIIIIIFLLIQQLAFAQFKYQDLVVNNYLLYKNKTDADTLKPIINDTIEIGKYIITYTDLIKKTYKNESEYLIEEQIITNRKYFFNEDTISIAFTNYCTDWKGLDSLNSVFLYPNGNLGLIAVNTYSPGSTGACGGSDYNKLEIYSFNNSILELLTNISFDGCLGHLIIDNNDYGKEQYIEKVYWSENGKILIFDIGNKDLLYKFNIDIRTWEI